MRGLRSTAAVLAVSVTSVACGGDPAAGTPGAGSATSSTSSADASRASATATSTTGAPSAPVADGKPLLTKSIASLDRRDLEAAIVELGFERGTTTWKEGDDVGYVVVPGTRPGPDGKPITLTLGLYRVSQAKKEEELARLKAEGPVRDQVDTILAVKVEPKDAMDAEATMKRLAGP